MRYVSIEHAKAGMILGKPFYGRLGELMLKENVVLTSSLIARIRELNYPGMYIKDELSAGIEMTDIISDELRGSSIKAIRRFMANVDSLDSHLIEAEMKQIAEIVDKIISAIMSMKNAVVNLIDIKSFDLYTYQHSVNVCVLSVIIGATLRLSHETLHHLALAAMLHDLGKVFIPKEVLNKPGRLTPEEFEQMKRHSTLGYTYVKDKFFFHHSVHLGILQHHERHDGTGYPLNKAGEDIVLFARIIAIADVFDAITSKRPYHDAILPSEAFEYISGNSGIHFNPRIVQVFTSKIAPFPLGLSVRLSNGLEGIVYKNYHDCLARPLIKLKPTNNLIQSQFLDLKNDSNALNITICEVLS